MNALEGLPHGDDVSPSKKRTLGGSFESPANDRRRAKPVDAHAAEPSPSPGPRTRRFVAWTLRRGKLLWAIALLLAIPATWRTVSLYRNLRTEIEELLPRDAPSVIAIGELRRRMAGLQHLGVIVAVPDPARMPAAERFLDDLAARVAAYPKSEVSEVRTGFAAERAFVEANAARLIALEDLATIRERIEDRLRWEYGKRAGTLLDDSEPAPSLDFSDVERKYAGQLGGKNLDGDRFSSRKLGVTLMLVEVGGFSTSAARSAALIERVKGEIAALGGTERYAPGLEIGFTADVAISAEESAALKEDLGLSSALVIVAVLLSIVGFYRWRRSVPVLLLPLLLSTVYAFAVASLPPFGITELNSNTAFLGSIIIGNGINFGIILLARYVEARRNRRPVEDSLAIALWGTRNGTIAAALAAGMAYASLVAMQFRGFRQFGVIGGLGMVLAWAVTYLLMPPLVSWLDRGHTIPGAVPQRRPMAALARLISARPRLFAAGATLLTILSVWEVRKFGADQLEYNFSRLRRRDTWQTGEGYWGRKMDKLLGRYLTPTAILTDSEAEARAIAVKLKGAIAPQSRGAEGSPLRGMIASVRTYDDVVPPDEADKMAEVAIIRRKMTENVRAQLTAADRARLDRLVGDAATGKAQADEARPAAVPEVFTRGLRERDGTAGHTVLVYPNPAAAWWQGDTIKTFVRELRAIAETPVPLGGRPARVASGHALSADLIDSMERDGPLASLLAFLGVVAVVLLLFRGGIATPFVIGSLVVGVLWLLGLTMAFGIKINFVNFIAFPITFGIGVDYAVNVMARYVRDGGRSVTAAITGAGGAVGLCSLTTILGYSSLLVAQNVGLFLFGLLSVVGEIACLVAAVVVLPAVLLLVRPQSSPPLPSFEWDQATAAAARPDRDRARDQAEPE